MKYREYVKEGKERLYKANQGEQAALLLMNELCENKGINLYISMEEEADKVIATDYLEGIHQMELGKPLSYVLGYECFYGYNFKVNEDVLIPRPETEELVGLVLSMFDDKFSDREHVSVFDVATGSGAIGITLNLEERKMDVIASDISMEALKVAKENNDALHANVSFICGSMLDPFVDRDLHCDILVCNPPYIPSEEKMEHSVVDYRDVFEKSHLVLNEKAFLAFEMGYQQGEALTDLAKEYFKDATITVHKDMAEKDRMLTIEL